MKKPAPIRGIGKIWMFIVLAFLIQISTFSQVRLFNSQVESLNFKIRPYSIENLDSLKSVDWRKSSGITTCQVGLFEYKGDILKEEPEDRVIYSFNEDGRIVEQTYMKGKYLKQFLYDGDRLMGTNVRDKEKGKILQECIYEYDEKGRLIGEIKQMDRMQLEFVATTASTLKNKGPFNITYTYNEDDLVTQIMIYSNKGKYEYYRVRNTYNDSSQIVEKQICKRGHTEKGDFSKTFSKMNCGTKYEYKYDSEGREVEMSFYMPEVLPMYHLSEKPLVRTQNQYNEDDQVIKTSSFNRDGTLEAMSTYTYDSDGNLVEIETKKSAGFGSKTIMNYKEGLMVMKMEMAADNSLSSMISYAYDSNGFQTHIITHDPISRKKTQAIIISYQ